ELQFYLEDDQKIEVSWRTTKAKELFLYLLQHHGENLRKSTLSELLWPDFEEEKALSQLYTSIYHIRQTLGQFKGHFLLENIHDSYVLSIQNIKIDLVEWERDIIALPLLNLNTVKQ